MKRVSFKVAKAIKEAGYPQGPEEYAYRSNGEIYIFENMFDHIPDYCCDAPTYLEVWLWLCDKGIVFYPAMYSAHHPSGWSCYYRDNIRVMDVNTFGVYNTPEEAIIKAIDYLVDNDLIK